MGRLINTIAEVTRFNFNLLGKFEITIAIAAARLIQCVKKYNLAKQHFGTCVRKLTEQHFMHVR